jgi:hypothetical protein
MNLYWCTTFDHDEDWFVVAADADAATIFHEEEEGYAAGDAVAELVVAVPAHLTPAETGWPDDDLLRALGGQFVHTALPRAVRFGDRVYGEGLLEAQLLHLSDDELERHGAGRPNGTRRERDPT